MKVSIRLAIVGLTLVSAGGSALALARSLATAGGSRTAIQRPHRVAESPRTPRPGDLCNGGLDPLATIEIVPDVLINQAGREHVQYHSEIALRRGQKMGVAWSADLIDDRGNVVIAKLDAGTFAGQAGHVAFTRPLSTPLDDGFYSLRVRAAVTAEGEPADVVEAVQHVEVMGGRWTELDDQEWFERSRATQAFTAAELATRRVP
jgi:hypothetical protein